MNRKSYKNGVILPSSQDQRTCNFQGSGKKRAAAFLCAWKHVTAGRALWLHFSKAGQVVWTHQRNCYIFFLCPALFCWVRRKNYTTHSKALPLGASDKATSSAGCWQVFLRWMTWVVTLWKHTLVAHQKGTLTPRPRTYPVVMMTPNRSGDFFAKINQ